MGYGFKIIQTCRCNSLFAEKTFSFNAKVDDFKPVANLC